MIKYFCKSVPLVAVTVTVRLLTIEILATFKNYFVYSTTEIQIRLEYLYIASHRTAVILAPSLKNPRDIST